MTSSENDATDTRWMLEPPPSNVVQFEFSVGDDVELGQDVRQAIDGLLRSLMAAEVEGFGANCFPRCGDLSSCGTYQCLPLSNCQPLVKRPKCASYVWCAIMPG